MKKILLFILLEVILFSLLAGGFWVNNNYMSLDSYHQTTITIMRGNPSNDSLILDPDTTPEVYKGRKVNWIIDSKSNVDSFSIRIKKNSDHIFPFFLLPPSKFTREGSGTVYPRFTIGDRKLYRYDINWKMKGEDTVRTFDPKLSIKPTTLYLSRDLFSFIGICILFLLPFSVFRSAKKRPAQ